MSKIIVTVFIILTVSLPALAQNPYPEEHRRWEGSIFGGVSLLGGHQFTTEVSGSPTEAIRDVSIDYASGYQTGLRLAEHINDIWATDVEYSFANQPLRFHNLSPTVSSLALSHGVHHFSYSVSGMPFGLNKRFRPYAKIGLGASLYHINQASRDEALARGVELRDSWKFTTNFGGGFKYLILDHFAITMDGRDNISGIPSYGLPPKSQVVNGVYQPGFAGRGRQHNWQMSLGASFQFDVF